MWVFCEFVPGFWNLALGYGDVELVESCVVFEVVFSSACVGFPLLAFGVVCWWDSWVACCG